jgi:hypothetical protein
VDLRYLQFVSESIAYLTYKFEDDVLLILRESEKILSTSGVAVQRALQESTGGNCL